MFGIVDVDVIRGEPRNLCPAAGGGRAAVVADDLGVFGPKVLANVEEEASKKVCACDDVERDLNEAKDRRVHRLRELLF